MTAGGAQDTPRARIDRAGLLIALGLLVLAAVLIVDALNIQANVVYGMGPQVMPIIIAIGLIVLAIGNGVNALRGDMPEREDMDFRPVLLVLGGLAAMIATIGLGGGFIPAMTMLFAATATAFGRRAILTDLVVGFVIATIVYLVFSKLLTLGLPAGPLEQFL